jgi:hypothetical protein
LQVFSEGTLLAWDVLKAKDFFTRSRGLMFKNSIDKGTGMFFPHCNWIHTFFMKFPIDVVYLDKKMKIVDLETDLRPWRFCMPRFSASHVLELPSGTVNSFLLKTGGILECLD